MAKVPFRALLLLGGIACVAQGSEVSRQSRYLRFQRQALGEFEDEEARYEQAKAKFEREQAKYEKAKAVLDEETVKVEEALDEETAEVESGGRVSDELTKTQAGGERARSVVNSGAKDHQKAQKEFEDSYKEARDFEEARMKEEEDRDTAKQKELDTRANERAAALEDIEADKEEALAKANYWLGKAKEADSNGDFLLEREAIGVFGASLGKVNEDIDQAQYLLDEEEADAREEKELDAREQARAAEKKRLKAEQDEIDTKGHLGAGKVVKNRSWAYGKAKEAQDQKEENEG